MARSVYKRTGEFETVEELETEIRKVWGEIETDYLFKMYSIIPERFIAAIVGEGMPTTY